LVVGEVDAELVVDGSLVLGVGVGERGDDVFELAYQGFDFVRGVLAGSWLPAQVALDAAALAFDLGDPGRGAGDLAVHLEQFSVAGELGVAFLEAPPELELASFVVLGLEVARGCECFAPSPYVDAATTSTSTATSGPTSSSTLDGSPPCP
jgi:hypothetical protein